jgi:hypothetical protein
VVEASKRLVPVLVDCSKRGANADWMSRYGVRGFPTVIFLDSTGRQLEELGSRAPDAVSAQIGRIAPGGSGGPATSAPQEVPWVWIGIGVGALLIVGLTVFSCIKLAGSSR